MGRFRFRGRIKFSGKNVFSGSTNYIDPVLGKITVTIVTVKASSCKKSFISLEEDTDVLLLFGW